MRLQVFQKKNKISNMIIMGIVIIVALLAIVFLYRSYALYKEEKEFNILKGQIPDFSYDIKMLSVIVDGEKSKTVPSRGLYKSQVTCNNGTTGKWDYNAWNLTLENVSEYAKCSVEFTSNLTQDEYNEYIDAGRALRRNTYRGKDITSHYTDGSLYEMISSGRFDDIYVGDYINANNIKWLVADIDNYMYSGFKANDSNDGAVVRHHVTIIPANNLTSAKMNDNPTTEGGYYNSKMKQEVLPRVLNDYVLPAFGNHVLVYNTLLTTSVDKNVPSNAGSGWTGSSNEWEWHESQLDLMSETNVYGSDKCSSSFFDTGIDNRQYAIFALKPSLINTDGKGRFWYWLKNVSSGSSFARVTGHGYSDAYNACELDLGVRPRFLLG